MKKIILLMCVVLCTLLSGCGKETTHSVRYITKEEIMTSVMRESFDVQHAYSELKYTKGWKESRFYNQEDVKEATEKYINALEVYSDALDNWLEDLEDDYNDTTEYQDMLVVTTYKISDNDYNYLQNQYDVCQKELKKYKK